MKYSLAMLAAAAAVQAVPAPLPQGVTSIIAPMAMAPSGCMSAYSGTFGIVVMNITAGASGAVATQSADGQPAAGSSAPVSTISDHQPQASTGAGPAPVSTISDHQPQASTGAAPAPVSTISDGQPQAPTSTAAPVSTISDHQPQAPTMTMPAVSQISDGQPQAPTMTMMPVSQISDGQPQAPTATAQPVSTISDHQPQAPSGTGVSTISDHQPQAPTSGGSAPMSSAGASTGNNMVACMGSSTLELTLANGVLHDNTGRTGYIASNYQFQFDGPPQAGAIYTAGFSICSNGSLALGGSSVFYQCRSGNFFNLYNTNWAPQCNPVTINAVQLVQC